MIPRNSYKKYIHSFPPNVHDIKISIEAEEGFAKSKALVLSLIIIAALGVYWFLRQTPIDYGGIVVCTQEVKSCPDGSYVGRMGPKCEFASCPGEGGIKRQSMDTSDWKTYRNEEYGFEVKYPSDWEVKEDNAPAGTSLTLEPAGENIAGEFFIIAIAWDVHRTLDEILADEVRQGHKAERVEVDGIPALFVHPDPQVGLYAGHITLLQGSLLVKFLDVENTIEKNILSTFKFIK